MYEDLSKFPSGMKALGTWITSQETYPGSNEYMHYGLYSCRGTCQCGTSTYSAPGSNGHEMADVDWMVAQGADYLKIDSAYLLLWVLLVLSKTSRPLTTRPTPSRHRLLRQPKPSSCIQ